MAEKQIGKIVHYFGKVEVGIIELSDSLKVGEKIHVKGQHSDFFQDISSMQLEHAVISEGKVGDAVGVKLSQKVHEHDLVYKVVE